VNRRKRPRGFTLPEALVALTLLSSGLAATSLMLVQAMRHEREAACRTAAVRLAGSLAEQLRLLRRSDGLPLQSVTDTSESATCVADTGDCALELEAARVLAAWRTQVTASLPEGSVSTVAVLDEAAPSYLIRIEWPDPGATGRSALRLAVEP
jgi:type IV pilus assembly protein PilV